MNEEHRLLDILSLPSGGRWHGESRDGGGLCADASPLSQPTADSSPPRGAPSFLLLKSLLLLMPLLLTFLFYTLKSNTPLMDTWVHQFMAPAMQGAGAFWRLFPFSVAEVFIALFLVGSVLWLVRAFLLLAKKREGKAFLKRIMAFGCVLVWLWAIFCWTWNCTYYAAGFAEKNGLHKDPYTPEQLLQVTAYFAVQASRLSTQVPRNGDLSFAKPLRECFEEGEAVYDNLCQVYPGLSLSHRQAKPILCSRLQSFLGYTGLYFPFTGEANVNVDQTACLVPFTIAHEMAHQRMVASEDECNFLGVLACVSSGNVVFQYSGYLMGLIYLTNALNDLSPELMNEVMGKTFTDELRRDWNDNYLYWQSLKSPAREAASEAMDQVYDGYLKSQGQTLGLMSYSACVDLLVNYFY